MSPSALSVLSVAAAAAAPAAGGAQDLTLGLNVNDAAVGSSVVFFGALAFCVVGSTSFRRADPPGRSVPPPGRIDIFVGTIKY